MEKAKVYYSDLRTSPTSNLLDKMERLLKRAGIEQLPLKDSFAAIKIHFGEPGNLAYLRPNYAARMATLLRSLGAKPFLTDGTQNRHSDSRCRYCNQYEPLQGARTSRFWRRLEESGHGMCQCRRKAGTALRLATQD